MYRQRHKKRENSSKRNHVSYQAVSDIAPWPAYADVTATVAVLLRWLSSRRWESDLYSWNVGTTLSRIVDVDRHCCCQIAAPTIIHVPVFCQHRCAVLYSLPPAPPPLFAQTLRNWTLIESMHVRTPLLVTTVRTNYPIRHVVNQILYDAIVVTRVMTQRGPLQETAISLLFPNRVPHAFITVFHTFGYRRVVICLLCASYWLAISDVFLQSEAVHLWRKMSHHGSGSHISIAGDRTGSVTVSALNDTSKSCRKILWISKLVNKWKGNRLGPKPLFV